jgi:TM2 domain
MQQKLTVFPIILILLLNFRNLRAEVISVKETTDFNAISKLEDQDLASISNADFKEFLELTPSKIKDKTGKKLSWKEVIALKKAQKKIKKHFLKGRTNEEEERGEKSQLTTFLLCFFFGYLGIHRFYLGYIGIGIIQLLTFGGCGIWFFIDFIMILTGDLKVKGGKPMKPW